MNSRAKVLLLFVASTLTFSLSLANGYSFDDVVQVRDNEYVRTLAGALTYLWKPVFPGDLYRPVTMLTYWATATLSGGHVLGQHVINLVLYGLISVLAYRLLQKLFSEALAFWAVILFLLNPIHTEVVATVVGRAELLSAAFLLGLLGMVAEKNLSLARRTFIGALLFLLALLSKESAITAILLVPLVILFLQVEQKKQLIYRWSVLLGITACVYISLRFFSIGPSLFHASNAAFIDNPLITLSAPARATKAGALLGRYMFMCILPFRLSADYSFRETTPDLSPYDLASLLFLAGVILYALVRRTKDVIPLFSVLWFGVSFLPTSNILFPIGTVFGERLAFIPSLGASLLLAHTIRGGGTPRARNAAMGLVSIAYLLVSILYQPVWKNDQTLWSYQLLRSPQSIKTLHNAASQLRRIGEFERALELNTKALNIFPQYAHAHLLRGILFYQMKNYSISEKHFKAALEISPDLREASNGLGILYFNN